MPLFYFALKCGPMTVPDCEGTELENLEAARVHAITVARELMAHREVRTRPWRIIVCDDYLQKVDEVLFAEIDQTLAHLPPHYRRSFESVSRTMSSMHEALEQAQKSLLEVKQTIAQADRLTNPVLLSGFGRREP